MAGTELIIDDDYCKNVGEILSKQGQHMDEVVAEYISILQTIKDTGIKSGEVSDALSAYISYAQKMEKQFGSLSETIKTQISNFLSQIDRADQYIF